MALQTRYNIRLARVFAAVFCLNLFLFPVVTSADDYGVTANVPFPAPTQAAIITSPPDGTTVTDALQTISGTCELLSPQGAVSIWRNGASIGSGVCNGSFSIPVMLQTGTNVLIARSASASALYGPDSSPLTLTLNLPPNIPPPTGTSGGVIPTSTTPPARDTNAGAAAGLTVSTSQPFGTLGNSHDVTITVTVAGGVRPYTIVLNWGDGSIETHSADRPGLYNFIHHYVVVASYTIRGQVRDSLGAISEFSYAVISTKKPVTKPHQTLQHTITHSPPVRVAAIIVLAIIILLAGDYWLGWHQAKKHFMKIMQKKRSKKKSAKRRKTRKKVSR